MKKFLLYLFSIMIVTSGCALADDGLWDNFGDSNVYGQKPVTQKEFEKALESKKKKKKDKTKDKNLKNGENFSQSNETDVIKDITSSLPILIVPINLKVKEGYIVPVGYYQADGEKTDGIVYIKLYQAHDLIAKIPAVETDDDFGEQTINFVKLLPHGDYHVKIIYGGLDFNAYAVIDTE
ncbi:hypothetical protein II810_04010 [bacterium]|nr:hypothetical protein [bacterium]